MKQTLLLRRPRGVQRPTGGKAKAWAFQPWKASAYWSFECRTRVAAWWALRLPAQSLARQQQCSGAGSSTGGSARWILSLINRRSVKTWNGAAFFAATETLLIFFFFFLEGLNLNERKWGENMPDFCVSMNEPKECLSPWKAPCFDGALMDFSKDSLNASPSSIGNSYVLKLAPCHVYLCSILPSKIASLLSFPNIQSSINT